MTTRCQDVTATPAITETTVNKQRRRTAPEPC